MSRIDSGDLGLRPECAAEAHGDIPFLSDEPWRTSSMEVRTIADFAIVVNEYADKLWAAGLRAKECLALVKANHIDIQAIAAAAVRIGAVPALLSAQMEPSELVECLMLLGRPTLLVDTRGAERLDPLCDAVRRHTSRVWSLDRPWRDAPVLEEGRAHVVGPRDDAGPMLITHSSGTTGTPKLAVHSGKSLFGHVAPQIAIARKVHAEAELAARCLSFVHARCASGLLATLAVPLRSLAMSEPSLARTRETLLRYRPDALETHPNIFILWEALADDPEQPLATVRRFTTSFDAVHPRTVRRLLLASKAPEAIYVQVYGQTETGPVTFNSTKRSELDSYRPRDVGLPFDGHTRVRVVDDAGRELAANQVGRVEIRSPGQVLRLLGAATFPQEQQWWPMGDLGSLGADGHLELLDREVDHVPGVDSTLRAEDALLTALPELTEVVLLAHPVDASCVAVVTTLGDRPLDEARWDGALRSAGLTVAVRLVHLPWRELPLTGSWKVRRHRLRESLRQA